MAVTRFSQGGVSITLDDGLARFARRLLDAASKETVRTLEAAAGKVAAAARGAWYRDSSGVTRKTGETGDIQVVTTLSDTEVRVSVGSTATEQVGGKPRAVLVHRPGRLSLVPTEVSRAQWWAWKKDRKPVGKLDGEMGTIFVPNPKASDGKYLVAELVRKPMRAQIKVVAGELGRAIAARASGRS